MIGRTEVIEFIEPSLRGGCGDVVCIRNVAALLCVGFTLRPVGPNAANHEDVTVGCERIPQFKDAQSRKLERKVRFYFQATKIPFDGALIGPPEFALRWVEDAALRRLVEAMPTYNQWCALLVKVLNESGSRAFLAAEDERSCYARIGGQTSIMKDFHEMMEGGF